MTAASDALYTALSSVDALGDRVYPTVMPQDVSLPAVVYHRTGGEPAAIALEGPALQPPAQSFALELHVERYGTDRPTDGGSILESVRAVLYSMSGVWRLSQITGEQDDYHAETERRRLILGITLRHI